MGTKLRSKISLLFVAFAVMLAIPAVALADIVYNDVVAGGNDTITAGGSTTITYKIQNTNSNNSTDPQNSCNPADGSDAFVTINAPAAVTVSGSDVKTDAQGKKFLQFNACEPQSRSATFSSNTAGNYAITHTVTDSGVGTYTTNQADFTLKVNAAAATNQAPSKPGTPALATGSSSPNQGIFDLSWTASTDDGLPSGSSISYALEHKDANDPGFSSVAANLSSNSYSFASANKESEGTWVYRVQAADGALNSPYSDESASVKVDKSKPVFGACPSAGPFLLNSGLQSVGPISASDPNLADGSAGSGVNNANSTLSGLVNTNSVGTKNVTFAAVDNADNSDQKICPYSVIYDFKGFYRPIDNGGVLNVAKAGSSIPVKFSLTGDQGLSIFAANSPASQKINCDTSAPQDVVEETAAAGSSGLSYDSSIDQYNYVWKTDKAWAGTCRQLSVTLNDGEVYKANFKLTK